MTKLCAICERQLSPKNKSGYCKNHANQMLANPERSAKISAALKRYNMIPENREKAAAVCRANCHNPRIRQIRSETAKRIGLADIGRAVISADPAILRKRAAKQSASLLSWCPRELREEYHKLVRSNKLPAAQAREIILAQHEADMARFRREIAA